MIVKSINFGQHSR